MPPKAYIFQCSNDSYISCIEKGLFGSNKPWPLQIVMGDYCLLHHYDVGSLFALWRAETNGGKNLMPRMWGGKFPNQVKVTLATPKIIEVPKSLLVDFQVDPAIGRFPDVVDDKLAEPLIRSLLQSP